MVLPRFVAAALRGDDLEVHGDGKQTRCFVDIRDVIPSLPRLVESPACHGRVFNIGSDQPISMRSLAQQVIDTISSKSAIRMVPYDQVYAAGFEDLRQRQPDLTRIREAIGFRPRIGLEETIRDLAAMMRDQPSERVP